jgi:protein phosphatase
MALEVYGDTDTGCVRSDNEDRIHIDASTGLFVVCDGMGGHQHGEIAAELAIAAIKYYIDASKDRFDVSWPFGYLFDMSLDANRLATSIRLANRQVWRKAEQSIECSGMGTTIASVLLAGNQAIVGNIGDSRVYLFRNLELTQLSTDDTMVASMQKRGLLSAADAAIHPMRNVLTQAAGSAESLDVHTYEQEIKPGDSLLLCSDGLYGAIDEVIIRSILSNGEDLQGTVERLISSARQAGAPDNISAVLLRLGS